MGSDGEGEGKWPDSSGQSAVSDPPESPLQLELEQSSAAFASISKLFFWLARWHEHAHAISGQIICQNLPHDRKSKVKQEKEEHQRPSYMRASILCHACVRDPDFDDVAALGCCCFRLRKFALSPARPGPTLTEGGTQCWGNIISNQPQARSTSTLSSSGVQAKPWPGPVRGTQPTAVVKTQLKRAGPTPPASTSRRRRHRRRRPGQNWRVPSRRRWRCLRLTARFAPLARRWR
eukprot:scaffold828_cov103-Isochrysis_galbana.AAC.2